MSAKFRDRIDALRRVQRLLSRMDRGNRIFFDQLVESELTALGGFDARTGKVSLKRPSGVALPSSAVQTLALAIHELCTNALKYGALHQPEGRLSDVWRLRQEDGDVWLEVDWRERGVVVSPPNDAAPHGSGSGRELIERALPYQLGAKTSFTTKSDGIHCTIALPYRKRS